MKPVPLYTVRYFKGEETRLISKHLHEEPAHQMAERFIDNLKRKKNEEDINTLSAITELNEDDKIARVYSLTDLSHEPLREGVTVTLEAQEDPNWDYPQYADPRVQGSGHMTTDRRRKKWPFTLIPK